MFYFTGKWGDVSVSAYGQDDDEAYEKIRTALNLGDDIKIKLTVMSEVYEKTPALP